MTLEAALGPELTAPGMKATRGYGSGAGGKGPMRWPRAPSGGIPARSRPVSCEMRAWRAIEPHVEQRLNALREACGEARAHGRGSERPEEIAAAVAQGRVGTLMVAAERNAEALDELAEGTLRTGGEVMVLEAERMPAKTGVAAVFRY